MSIVGGIFLTIAACRFVLFLGTISAVRFFGVLVGIGNLSTDYADYTDRKKQPRQGTRGTKLHLCAARYLSCASRTHRGGAVCSLLLCLLAAIAFLSV